jgi:hypothetical protein
VLCYESRGQVNSTSKGLETSWAPSGLGPDALPTTLYVDPVFVTAGAGPMSELVYDNEIPSTMKGSSLDVS